MAEIVKKRKTISDRRPASTNASVIESEVFDASRKAKAILDQAEAKAQEIIEDAEAKADEIRQESEDTGYDAGYEKGAQEFHEALVQLNHEYDQFLSEAQSEIMEVAVAISRKVLQKELASNPKVIIEMVRKALVPMNRKHAITVTVHPDDLELLEANRAELLSVMVNKSNIIFNANEKMARGGCVIETEHGSVDSRLETQFALLTKVVTGKEHAYLQEVQNPEASEPEESIEPQEQQHYQDMFDQEIGRLEDTIKQASLATEVQPIEQTPEASVPEYHEVQELQQPQDDEQEPVFDDLYEGETLPEANEVEAMPQAEIDTVEVEAPKFEALSPEDFSEEILADMEKLAEDLTDDEDINELLNNLDSMFDEE